MTTINAPITSASTGQIGRLLAARVDFATYPNAAEEFTNCWPLPQGPWTRRPPLNFIDTFVDSTRKALQLPFVTDDQSYNILTTEDGFELFTEDGKVDNALVTTAILDGTFGTTYAELVASATLTSSTLAAGNLLSSLKDGLTTETTWSGAATGTLTIDLGSAMTVYDLWLTASSLGREAFAPRNFTVKGSTSGAFAGEEVTILTITSGANWDSGELRKHRITSPGSYRYYKITMTSTASGSGSYTLAEVAMYASPWLDNSTGDSAARPVGGRLWLDSDGGSYAVAEQKVTIATSNTRHILKFDVYYGPINLRIGTTTGEDDLLGLTELGTGTHLLEFNPTTGSFYVAFYHHENAGRAVDNVSIVSSTRYLVPHPYVEDDLPSLQWQQIGDVLYLAHAGYWPRRLERRGHRSWSVVKLLPADGPFNTVNTSAITIAGDAVSGEIGVTASEDLFSSADEGVIYKVTGAGQTRVEVVTSEDNYTEGIKVTGIGKAARTFTYEITGTFVASVTLQRSSGNENDYNDFQTFTTATAATYYDALDNQTWYYRLAVKPGNYTSGTVNLRLAYSGGSSEGIFRIITVTDAQTATAEVLQTLASTAAVKTWKRGAWNGDDLYPTGVTAGYGRLWFGRGIKVWGSKSDNFTSFNEASADVGTSATTLADDAISVTMTSASSIQWMGFLGNLIIGTKTREFIGVPNTASQPVGPSNFQIMPATNRGGVARMPAAADGSMLFILKTSKRLMQFTPNPKSLNSDSYVAVDLNELSPDLLKAGIVRIAIQRNPEPRVYVVLKNGTCGVLLFRRDVGDLGIAAWSVLRSKLGYVEDVNVVSEDERDGVYMVVRRVIDGSLQRSVQKLGPDQVTCDEDDYYLDAALSYDLTRPDATLTVSDSTGTITVEADDDVFAIGDVGSILWLLGGRATIASYVNAHTVTASVIFDLTEVDEWDSPLLATSGAWGFAPTVTSVSGLDHLEGETVRIYADRADAGTAVVASGQVALPSAASVVHVGLEVKSRWKSMKLSYGAQKGTALTQVKQIKDIRFVLDRTGPGIYVGYAYASMKPLKTPPPETLGAPPLLYTGELSGDGFGMKTSAARPDAGTDPRVHIEVRGCAPATVLAYVPQIDERDR